MSHLSHPPLPTSRRFSRRTLFAGATALSTTALAAAGCSSSDAPASSGVPDQDVTLPTYVRFDGVTPDIPGTEDGIPDTFFTYPADPQPVLEAPPADGTALRASVPINNQAPPPMDRNEYWQELNERIGSELELTITPNADFSQRFATAVSGNALGDMFTLDLSMAQLPEFLSAQAADLTEHLAGDAIKEYPFLANLPTDSWRGCVFNGGIYALPVTRGVQTSTLLFTRDDLFEARGVDPDPTTIDDFFAVCREMTDARANRWALTGVPMGILQQMVGTPNTWAVDESGAFTHMLETEQYKEALELGRKLFEEDLVHPDALDAATPDMKMWFGAGSGAIHQDTYSATSGMWQQNAEGIEEYSVGLMLNPGVDGQAAMWLGNPNNTLSAIAKSEDPERVKMLLRVANFLAAPLGTAEHLFIRYGIEGTHFEFEGTEPVLSDKGSTETSMGYFPVEYLVAGPRHVYFPGQPEIARSVRDHMEKAVPQGVRNPTVGLYSPTQGRQGGRLDTTIDDELNSVLTGRTKVAEWDAVVEDWRAKGGDDIRAEYEEAYAAAS